MKNNDKLTLKKCAYILSAIKNLKKVEYLKNNSSEKVYTQLIKKSKVKGIKF